MDFENHLYNWSGIYISEIFQESLKIVTHFLDSMFVQILVK